LIRYRTARWALFFKFVSFSHRLESEQSFSLKRLFQKLKGDDPMTTIATRSESAGATGIILHTSGRYDFLLWLLTLGRETAFREKMLRFAELQPGESVLDIGCGTGSLAIAAKRQVGAAGAVCGVDASPEMLARAEKKARSLGVEVSFQNGLAQSLPFGAAQFDVVLSTVMLHHLPKSSRREMTGEVRRVLKPGGRMLVIDFGRTGHNKKSIFDHLHARHGHVDLKEVVDLLTSAGLRISDSGAVGMRGLHFVVATLP
jgi:ubiquinone/menaquinone biosynthesis C-methylase UbiE